MAHQHPPRFLKIVDDAKTRVRETNVNETKKRMDRGDKFILIDVREESEYAKDHLPGAIHPLLCFVHIRFANPGLGVVDNFQRRS